MGMGETLTIGPMHVEAEGDSDGHKGSGVVKHRDKLMSTRGEGENETKSVIFGVCRCVYVSVMVG